MKKIGKILVVLCLTISMVFSGQYISEGISGSNYVNAASKVRMSKKSVTIFEKETIKLKILGTKKKVSWKSSNKKVAIVSKKGKVKGIRKGKATITATVGKKKYTCKIKVEEFIEDDLDEENYDEEDLDDEDFSATPAITSTATPTVSPKITAPAIQKETSKPIPTVSPKITAPAIQKETSKPIATVLPKITAPAIQKETPKPTATVWPKITAPAIQKETPKPIATVWPEITATAIQKETPKPIATVWPEITAPVIQKETPKPIATVSPKVTETPAPTEHVHQYESSITKKSTCTEEGIMTYTCACGDTYMENIAKINHTYASTVVPPTCTEQGYTEHKCSGCGEIYKDNYTDMTEHTLSLKEVIPASKAGMGYTAYTCGVCKNEIKDNWTEYDPTEEEVYADLMAMQEKYPEGMPWTNDNYYRSSDCFQGYGCHAFALLMSDEAFGYLEFQNRHTNFENLRVGDLVRTSNDTHTVVILEIRESSVIVAEGNYNSSIHWGREISLSAIQKIGTYVLTRYPD